MAKRSVAKAKQDKAAFDQLWKHFTDSGAQLNKLQEKEMERQFCRDDGITRRVALSVLTQSGGQLVSAVQERETAEAMAAASVSIRSYHKWLSNFCKLLETASTRIELALCDRPDMRALLRKAEAGAK